MNGQRSASQRRTARRQTAKSAYDGRPAIGRPRSGRAGPAGPPPVVGASPAGPACAVRPVTRGRLRWSGTASRRLRGCAQRPGPRGLAAGICADTCSWCALRVLAAAAPMSGEPMAVLVGLLGNPSRRCQADFEAGRVANREAHLLAAGFRRRLDRRALPANQSEPAAVTAAARQAARRPAGVATRPATRPADTA